MRYAARQLRRDQVENGYDYGSGHRWVLVHTTGKEILFVEGGRVPTSDDPDRTYLPSRIVAFPDDREPDRQRVLATGRMNHAVLKQISKEIFEFLGCEPFDTKFISRQYTLLLDVPGTIDGPMVSTSKLTLATKHLLAAGTVSLDDDVESYIAAQPDAADADAQPDVVPQAIANHTYRHIGTPAAKTFTEQLAEAEKRLFAAADEYALIKILWQRETGRS